MFTIAAIAAHERRHVAVVDIGSVFLNAKMSKGVPVYMRLDKTISEYLIRIDSKYAVSYSKYETITEGAVWVC